MTECRQMTDDVVMELTKAIKALTKAVQALMESRDKEKA